jgi:hypothetical protein
MKRFIDRAKLVITFMAIPAYWFHEMSHVLMIPDNQQQDDRVSMVYQALSMAIMKSRPQSAMNMSFDTKHY